jgi:hypothetical protein
MTVAIVSTSAGRAEGQQRQQPLPRRVLIATISGECGNELAFREVDPSKVHPVTLSREECDALKKGLPESMNEKEINVLIQAYVDAVAVADEGRLRGFGISPSGDRFVKWAAACKGKPAGGLSAFWDGFWGRLPKPIAATAKAALLLKPAPSADNKVGIVAMLASAVPMLNVELSSPTGTPPATTVKPLPDPAASLRVAQEVTCQHEAARGSVWTWEVIKQGDKWVVSSRYCDSGC